MLLPPMRYDDDNDDDDDDDVRITIHVSHAT